MTGKNETPFMAMEIKDNFFHLKNKENIMPKEELIQAYLAYLTEYVNDFQYSDIDGFLEQNEVSQEDEEFLLSLNLIVTEDK